MKSLTMSSGISGSQSKPYSIEGLAATLQWWLSYTLALNREYVLGESAMKLPFTEYLERTRTVDRDTIKLERQHPVLKGRRIDLCFDVVSPGKGKIETAFEFKFIKEGSTLDLPEKKRVFNDLMRLHLFASNGGHGHFLICGTLIEFINSFQEQKTPPASMTAIITPRKKRASSRTIKSKGYYSEWFSFDLSNPVKQIDLGNKDAKYKDVYDGFVSEYKEAYQNSMGHALVLPNKIKTELVFLPSNTVNLREPPQARVGVWKVHG